MYLLRYSVYIFQLVFHRGPYLQHWESSIGRSNNINIQDPTQIWKSTI